MAKMKRVLLTSLMALMAFSPAAASAACRISDFAGTWQVYTTAVSGTNIFWARCKISINASGVIADSICSLSTGQNVGFVDGVVQAISAADCSFRVIATIGGTRHSASHVTLARDSLTAKGVGKAGTANFVIDIVKI